MLKKMKRRFIVAAMTAFFFVIALLSVGVNIWNYGIVAGRQDRILDELSQMPVLNQNDVYENNFSLPWPFAAPSREMPYMLRYFAVKYDENGDFLTVYKDFIASVSTEDARQYAEDVIDSGRVYGYYKGYRFLVCKAWSFTQESEEGVQKLDDISHYGVAVYFLNSEQELSSVKNIFIVTIIIALVSLLAVFFLLLAFAERAIKPYIRNIETQKQFITDVSHELKTPLTAISTSADILAMMHEFNEEASYQADMDGMVPVHDEDKEWIENIQSQSAKMADLIKEMITLSRLDEEKPFPDKKEFSLSDAVWEISESFEARARATEKTITQDISDNVMMTGDKAAIQQAISVLLDNALKYSDEKGVISLSVRSTRKKIEIEVVNSCSSNKDIDPQRVFDRFYRADSARTASGAAKKTDAQPSAARGGYGLGLSIAKSIALRHKGDISVKLVGEHQVRFLITLPVK